MILCLEVQDMSRRRLICFLTALVLAVSLCASALALDSGTLKYGSRGEAVRKLQQALIDQGYLKGSADGVFGNQTENAVRAFQKAKKLKVDGLAGKKTQELLYGSSGSKTTSSSSSASSSSTTSSSGDGSLFGGNYTTIRLKNEGARVKTLQSALIRLNYLSGKADGKFGSKTLDAVALFQKENGLSVDGLAGKKTLKAIETADKNGTKRGSTNSSSTTSSSSSSSGTSSSSSGTAVAIQEESKAAVVSTAGDANSVSSSKTATAPDGTALRLLHWFNDIKLTLKGGNQLLVYDPETKIFWTLRVHSCGRHCDAEPLTAQDTANMLKAFGGVNTWDQKAVYVKLPSGIWTLGSTHDMPHMSGTISTNNFNGHLCVHFLRDMDEAKANDPSYGVANQETIRAKWKALTGEVLSK
jgi:peptidoglycan hydrolase-like protein with peptidoglycan-binding domain